jgi:hypothetical protein
MQRTCSESSREYLCKWDQPIDIDQSRDSMKLIDHKPIQARMFRVGRGEDADLEDGVEDGRRALELFLHLGRRGGDSNDCRLLQRM